MDIFPVHDPVVIFSIVMMAVLVAPLLAERVRLPGIIGLIFFGIILGPYVTNVLERDRTIELLGTIGLLYIMFQAGIEINLEEIKKNKHHSVMFGLLTFLIPLISGTLAGYYLLNLNLPSSILLASMFSSHTLLTFPIVSRMGLAQKKSVTATIGGTIITDTLAFVVLAVIIAAETGELDLAFWLRLATYSGIYVFSVVFFLPKITVWFFRYFVTESGVEDYVFVITALFVSSFFSHLVGLEPIIGAFLAGLILNPLIPGKSVLMNRIRFVGDSLFIPFFLISVGMLIDPSVLFTETSALKVAFIMTFVAFFSKDLASRVFSKIVKFTKPEQGLVFGMSVNQAAATLAVVLVAYNIGIFEEDILTGTIVMIVATCFFGSILTQKYARKVALSEKGVQDLSGGEKLERILIPISGHDNVIDLMDFAFLLHPDTSHEPLYPLHIALEGPDVEKEIIEGETILTKASVRAGGVQRAIVPLNKIDYNIPSAIVRAVNEQRISKLIVGWSKSGQFISSFYETTTEKIAKMCDKMIFVTRIVKPLSIMERIVLIVPPYVYRQNGFIDTINSLQELRKAVSTEWFIISEEETFNEIVHLFPEQRHNVKHLFVRSWKRVVKDLDGYVGINDLVIQILPRHGSVAWRMIFDQLPGNLKNRFKVNNIVVVYPFRKALDYSKKEQKHEQVEQNGNEVFDLVPASNFYLNMHESDPFLLFEKLRKNRFFSKNENVIEVLREVLNEFPLEMTKEIVLVHSRTDMVADYQIYIAVNRNGFKIDKLEGKHKIIFILLSPEDKSTQSHLNILSKISRFATIGRLVDALLKADSYQNFTELMKGSRN